MIKSFDDSGKNANEIYSLLNKTVPKATVYRWVNRITAGKIATRTSPGRPRSFKTKTFIAKVRRKVQLNKKNKSARSIDRTNGCAHTTVLKTIHDDLGLKAYKKIKVPALIIDHIAKRLTFSHCVKKISSCRSIIFSEDVRSRWTIKSSK